MSKGAVPQSDQYSQQANPTEVPNTDKTNLGAWNWHTREVGGSYWQDIWKGMQWKLFLNGAHFMQTEKVCVSFPRGLWTKHDFVFQSCVGNQWARIQCCICKHVQVSYDSKWIRSWHIESDYYILTLKAVYQRVLCLLRCQGTGGQTQNNKLDNRIEQHLKSFNRKFKSFQGATVWIIICTCHLLFYLIPDIRVLDWRDKSWKSPMGMPLFSWPILKSQGILTFHLSFVMGNYGQSNCVNRVNYIHLLFFDQ